MASSAINGDRALDLTEAVVTLQQTTRKFIADTKAGREGFVLRPFSSADDENGTGNMLIITSPDKEIKTHLETLEMQLRVLEQRLRSRGDWHPSDQVLNIPLPTILDIVDLSNAITLLDQLITSTSPGEQATPQQTLSAYSWTWDPAWHEFYTYMPSQQTYLYLSRWKLNETRNVWEHVSMAGVNLMPTVAVEMLGAWEDWTWDSTWKQWYLDVSENDTEEKSQIFASPWRVQGDGEWVYVGRIGGVN
ncbi:hypothetical protein J4E93_005845 [Alternaria ventricosa]|uniref:uncharacterized protein n=1 Tax=Alternaria ventricosa TaxID=1187951 RepID=UPI0020C51082|nr:uncharacterized protein J4E93_005845 [Alternaria ventricosa]KAI4645046.1 hypothetical protein J4E93_005845 [Alternaria ventricosa]